MIVVVDFILFFFICLLRWFMAHDYSQSHSFVRYLAAPFLQGAENFKKSLAKDSDLNLPERVGRFALGSVQK